MFVIYRIVNKVNDNKYIGSTINFVRRKREHINLLNRGKHHSRYLQSAWNKYGNQNFEFEIILTVDDIKLLQIEENRLIKTTKPEYNMMADVFSHIGMKRSVETREKISKSLTGKKISKEHKEKVRLANIGKKQSKEVIAKRMVNNYKPILAYDKKSGLFVKEYKSPVHVANELGIDAKCIREVSYGRKKSYKGFIWKKK